MLLMSRAACNTCARFAACRALLRVKAHGTSPLGFLFAAACGTQFGDFPGHRFAIDPFAAIELLDADGNLLANPGKGGMALGFGVFQHSQRGAHHLPADWNRPDAMRDEMNSSSCGVSVTLSELRDVLKLSQRDFRCQT